MKDLEADIAKKYIIGGLLDVEDERTVDRMELVGIMKTGLRLSTMQRTAITTQFGVRCYNLNLYKKYIKLKQRMKNAIKMVIHG